MAVGERWEVPAAGVRRLFGPQFRVDSLRWAVMFDRVATVDHRRVAVMTESLDVKGRGGEGEENQVAAAATLTGTTAADLDDPWGYVIRLTGTISETTETVADGQKLRVVTTGPAVVELTSARP